MSQALQLKVLLLENKYMFNDTIVHLKLLLAYFKHKIVRETKWEIEIDTGREGGREIKRKEMFYLTTHILFTFIHHQTW